MITGIAIRVRVEPLLEAKIREPIFSSKGT